MTKPVALITGAGSGLSASLARMFAHEGYKVVLAARDAGKLTSLAMETGASVHACDVTNASDVEDLFAAIQGPLRVAVAHPSARVRGAIADLDPEDVRQALMITAYGSFLVGQEAARVMLEQEPENGVRGTILFTGASAGRAIRNRLPLPWGNSPSAVWRNRCHANCIPRAYMSPGSTSTAGSGIRAVRSRRTSRIRCSIRKLSRKPIWRW